MSFNSPEELTNGLLVHFSSRTTGTELLDSLVDEMGSRREAIAGIVEVTVPGYLDHPLKELPLLYRYVRDACSQRYDVLKTQAVRSQIEPLPTRVELNQDPLLYDLNAVRLGVHRALVHSQTQAATNHRYAQQQLSGHVPDF